MMCNDELVKEIDNTFSFVLHPSPTLLIPECNRLGGLAQQLKNLFAITS